MNTDQNLDSLIESIEISKQENNYENARNLALEGLKKYSDEYQIYEELADIYLFEWNFEKASEVLAIAREIHPESATGMYLAGYIASAKWEFDTAIHELNIANKHLPNNSEILRNLGWANVMNGSGIKWITLLRRAHSLSPEDVMILNDLAVALMTVWEEKEAREIMKKIGQEALFDSVKSIPFPDNP